MSQKKIDLSQYNQKIRTENTQLIPPADGTIMHYPLYDNDNNILNHTLSVGEVIDILKKVPSESPFFVFVFRPGKITRDTCMVTSKMFARNHSIGDTFIMVDLDD